MSLAHSKALHTSTKISSMSKKFYVYNLSNKKVLSFRSDVEVNIALLMNSN